MNITNARRSEDIRQGYVYSVIKQLMNLEIVLSDSYHSLERGEDIPERRIWEIESTIDSINSSLPQLMRHNKDRWQTPNMILLRRHVSGLMYQANEGDPGPAMDFLEHRIPHLLELVRELSLEGSSEWHREPNVKISTRQLFSLINAFMKGIDDEIRGYRHF
ncbi:MAG: hypothetical protein FWE91_09305 [Defluviitaleaceae bacterium]|nr:hypothetical protein [Defluviitaleaceae bacterium]MCL2835752.1 hypothetical protein [Defluviitaleaceae bacterium]